MKSIVFVVPFFTKGEKLPSYFQLWCETVKNNETIDFLFFTDAKVNTNIKNLKVINMNFSEMQDRVKKCFGEDIRIDFPYKLCDYKVAYGIIFKDYIKEYDFWGFCDIDLFWGNIRKFITDEILEEYERIYTRGHCSVFKNNDIVNNYFRTLPSLGCQEYKEVFHSSKSCCFDEWGGHCGFGLSEIMKRNGIKMYSKIDYGDINVFHGKFILNHLEKSKKRIYIEYFKRKFVCKR